MSKDVGTIIYLFRLQVRTQATRVVEYFDQEINPSMIE